MRRLRLVLVIAFLAAACGDISDTAATSTLLSTTTSTVPATTTTEALPTSTTTTTAVTTTTAARSPFREDGTLTALPSLAYWVGPMDGTAADVPWEGINEDWLLLLARTESPLPDALFLLDPDDRLYLLGGWEVAGSLQDWSPDGRKVVYFDVEGSRVVALDLLSGDENVIAVQGDVAARFTLPAGRDMAVRQITEQTASIKVYRSDGTLWSTLLDGGSEPSWLYYPDGNRVVLTDQSGVRLVSDQGEPISNLAAPGLACQAARWWGENSVLVSCIDPVYAATPVAGCWPGSGRGLWAVPLDGGPAQRVGPGVGPGGDCDQQGAYQIGMVDAFLLDNTLMVETQGCCEAGDVEIYLPSGRALTRLFGSMPRLVGQRNGRVVVVGYGPALLAEVASDGTFRAIRPDLAELGSGVLALSLTDPAGA